MILSLPRNGTRTFVLAVGVLALAALVLPQCLIAAEPELTRHDAMSGGGMTPLLLLVSVVAAVMVTVLGAVSLRGRRLPVASTMGVGLAPLLLALVVESLVHRSIARTLEGTATEPVAGLAAAFRGMGEESNTPLLAAVTCSVILLAVAAAATGVVSGSVTKPSLQKGRAPRVSLLLSLSWFVIGVSQVVSAKAVAGGVAIWVTSLVMQLVVMLLATMCTRASIRIPESDDVERQRLAGALVCAALASSLSLVLIDRGILAYVERHVWSVVSDPAMTERQRARMLHEWVVASRTFSLVALVHGVGSLLSFTPAILRTRGSAVSRSTIVTLAIFVSTLVAFLGITAERAKLLRERGRAVELDAVTSDDLPQVVDASVLPRSTRRARVVTAHEPAPAHADGGGVHTVAAAPMLTLQSVVAAFETEPRRGPEHDITLELLVRSQVPVRAASFDAELAPLVPRGLPAVVAVISLPIEIRFTGPRRFPSLFVTPGFLHVSTAVEHTDDIPLGPARAEALHQALDFMRPSAPDVEVALREDATVQDLVDVLTAFDRGWERAHLRIVPTRPFP